MLYYTLEKHLFFNLEIFILKFLKMFDFYMQPGSNKIEIIINLIF